MNPSEDYYYEHKNKQYRVYVFNQLLISHDIMIFEMWKTGYAFPFTFVIDKWADHGHVRFFEHALSTDHFDSEIDQMFITYLWYEMIPDQPWEPSNLDFGMMYVDEPIVFHCPAPFVVKRFNRMNASVIR